MSLRDRRGTGDGGEQTGVERALVEIRVPSGRAGYPSCDAPLMVDVFVRPCGTSQRPSCMGSGRTSITPFGPHRSAWGTFSVRLIVPTATWVT